MSTMAFLCQDSLCFLLTQLKQISEKEKRLQEMSFELANIELKAAYQDHINLEKLMEREVLTQKFTAHLSQIIDLDIEEISRRLRAPFDEEHIVINKDSHQKMIELVGGAFTDVLRSREDVDLAKWSHTAVAPVKPLVRYRWPNLQHIINTTMFLKSCSTG